MTIEQLQAIISANTTETGIDYDQIGREVVWAVEAR